MLWLSWNGNSQLGARGVTAHVPSAVFRSSGGRLSSRVGPKPSRKRWLHPLRKARLANLMNQAHGGECGTARTFTSLENSVRVGARPGAPLGLAWSGHCPWSVTLRN
jgi:hypothetical protein